jgi:hypothetical protein
MTSYRPRGRINCAPLNSRPIHGLLSGIPHTITAKAYLYEFFPMVPFGVLVEVNRTGRLCAWVGGGLKILDQRKAAAALSYMHYLETTDHDWRRARIDRDAAGSGDSGNPEDDTDEGIQSPAGDGDGEDVP